MHPLPRIWAAALITISLTSDLLPAHGGTYRGPSTYSAPRVKGGGAPSSSLPHPVTRSQSGQIPMPTALHDRSWFVWWEYHRSPYVYRDRRSADEPASGGSGAKPFTRSALPKGYVDQTLVPLMVKLLESRNGRGNRELITGALIALARFRPKGDSHAILTRYLKQNQEYAETAALALGISAHPAAFPILMSLAANRRDARKWVRGSKINYRTRSFALFGLGLWCHQSKDNYKRSQALALVLRILEDEANSKRRNLRKDTEVAALHAMRLIVADSSGPSAEVLRKDAAGFLVPYIQDRKKDTLLRSHAVTALGLALGRHEDPTGEAKATMFEAMKDRRASPLVQQSAVMALGFMGNVDDLEVIESLDLYARKGKDPHAQNLALIAMARIASDEARTRLIQRYNRTRGAWAALALAILDRERRQRMGTDEVDKTIADALQRGVMYLGSSEQGAALAIAMGIQDHAPTIRQVAAAFNPKVVTVYNAYVAESLGLLHARSSQKAMMLLARRSLRHPAVFSKTILALGQMGDPEVGSYLGKRIRTSRYILEKSSAALALGNVGGIREADQLIKIVKDVNQQDPVRGFAVVALGVMGEPTRLPWYHALMMGVNYLARTETLAGGGKGVLEIL